MGDKKTGVAMGGSRRGTGVTDGRGKEGVEDGMRDGKKLKFERGAVGEVIGDDIGEVVKETGQRVGGSGDGCWDARMTARWLEDADGVGAKGYKRRRGPGDGAICVWSGAAIGQDARKSDRAIQGPGLSTCVWGWGLFIPEQTRGDCSTVETATGYASL